MNSIEINYWAVLVAAVSNMIIGSIWYGPLFGKLWMKHMGHSAEKMNELKKRSMGKLYFVAFIGSFVMAYVLAHFAAVWGVGDVMGAVQLAFWIWLGFVATVVLSSVLWEGKSVTLYILNIAYYLVVLKVMAIILVVWK